MKNVGMIGNYYGGVIICEESGKFYWIVENYDTDLGNISEWEEIPESLYIELSKFKTSDVED